MSNVNQLNDFPLFGGLRATAPLIIGQYAEEQTHGEASTIDVTGASIAVPKGYFCPGTTFRFTVYGSRTGTGGAATLTVDINGSTAVDLAIPTDTAVDFLMQFTVHEVTTFARQQSSAICFTSATVLSAMDYTAATIDVSQDSTIKLTQTLANAADSIVIDYILIEYWKL